MKKSMVSNVCSFVCGAVIFGAVGVFAATYTATLNAYPVKFNGQDVQMEGYNIDGSTYFKLRDIGDKVGFNVDFQNNEILIASGGNTSLNSGTSTTYYKEKPWCPDYGAITGATLQMSIPTDDQKGHIYTYRLLKDYDVEKETVYWDMLRDLGFELNIASTSEKILFMKGDRAVFIATDDNTLQIHVLVDGE